MANKIVLSIGGTRSGKSAFAENYVKKLGERIAYIATGQAFDGEMFHRIALHQKRRPASWKTYESPLEADKALKKAALAGYDAILFDCIGIYLSNMLLNCPELYTIEQREAIIMQNMQSLIHAAKSVQGTVIFVSDEVGMGIVPENKLAREFRDLAGQINQMVAEEADEVYMVICGIPIDIKQFAACMED